VRLLVIRHAEAAPGEPDEERRLTPAGRSQAAALGERLAGDGIRADVVMTSPLVRARETGEIVARAFGCASEPSDALSPGATAAGVRDAISGRGEIVAIVAHQPDCGRIAAALGDGHEPPFPPAGVVAVELR
jgi:phosphohistidine phosphatase